jgi:hypothetical protein
MVGKTYALLIGIDHYKDSENWKNLENPIKDCSEIAKVLRRDYYCENPVIMKDPSCAEIFTEIQRYRDIKFDERDQLLVYLAGHGTYSFGEEDGLIVGHDSMQSDRTRYNYLPFDRVKASLDATKCKHILVMLDVCFGASFADRAKRTIYRGAEDATELGIDELIQSRAKKKTRVFISPIQEQVSDGSKDSHSPFAKAFLEGLAKYAGSGQGSYLNLTRIVNIFDPKDVSMSDFQGNEYGGEFLLVPRPRTVDEPR